MTSALVEAGGGIVALATVFAIVIACTALAELERVAASKIRRGDQLVALGEGTIDVLKVREHDDRVEITTEHRRFDVPAVTKLLRRKMSRRINMLPDLNRSAQ